MLSLLKSMLYRRMVPRLHREAVARNACIGLCYHRFEETAGTDPVPGMAVTAALFKEQVSALKQMGKFVSIDDLAEARTPDGLSFCLTFDDGYRDNLTVLRPLLEELNVPCCVYVTAGFVTGEFDAFTHDREAGYNSAALDAADLRELARHPLITIGAHTYTHPRLNSFSPETWARELGQARQRLEEELGAAVSHFAFPFGQRADLDWGAAVTALPEAGYRSVASNFGGYNMPDSLDRVGAAGKTCTHVRRVPITTSPDIEVFKGWTLGLCNRRERSMQEPCLVQP